MRRFTILAAALSILLLSAPAFAQQALNIAVFSAAEVVSNCDMYKDEAARFETTYAAERDNILRLETTIKQKMEQLNQQAGALSLDARQDRQTEIVRLQRDYEDAARVLGRKLEGEQARIQQAIAELLIKATENYGKANNIDILMDVSLGVAYHSDAVNVTPAIMNEVNALYRASK